MRQRATALALVGLAAVTIIQFIALRQMRHEVAGLRGRLVDYAVETRAEEIARTGRWLHHYLQSERGSGGLCPEGSPDFDRIQRFLIAYVRARGRGLSEGQAREDVLSALSATRASTE